MESLIQWVFLKPIYIFILQDEKMGNAIISHFPFFYAQSPLRNTGTTVPSFLIPSIFISAEPTIKST